MASFSELFGGGFNGFLDKGPSFASGATSATIVTALANVNGVRITYASLSTNSSNGSISIGGQILISTGPGGGVSTSGITAPAGSAIAFSGSSTTYYISYEVL